MDLIFEKSRPGRGCALLPDCDVPEAPLAKQQVRRRPLRLPAVAEVEISRHYSALAKRSYGVNSGFYPLGSCTMKYNPSVNEQAAALPGFADVHPLAPAHAVQGCLKVLALAEEKLCAVTGMDAMTFQPSAGAQGEYVGLLLVAAWHSSRGQTRRKKILVPDSAHGTNPASAAMAGFEVVNIRSDARGCVDLAALRAAVGDDTAGLMLTNPNTLGVFDPNIMEITRVVHEAGGLCYYDGANLNAVMGVVRPGDMGFDVVHLNLHKTFSTPHGGGGPGAGPVGCKAFLRGFLPDGQVVRSRQGYTLSTPEHCVGRVRAFWGNFLVAVRALAYLLTLGEEGVKAAAEGAVLNANYLKRLLEKDCDMAQNGPCMHEFVIALERLKKETGVSALDVAKALIDCGMHPPTMYFPLIVHESLMVEPTETESKDTLDAAAEAIGRVIRQAGEDAARLLGAPHTAPVSRPDEVGAARNPRLSYQFETQ